MLDFINHNATFLHPLWHPSTFAACRWRRTDPMARPLAQRNRCYTDTAVIRPPGTFSYADIKDR